MAVIALKVWVQDLSSSRSSFTSCLSIITYVATHHRVRLLRIVIVVGILTSASVSSREAATNDCTRHLRSVKTALRECSISPIHEVYMRVIFSRSMNDTFYFSQSCTDFVQVRGGDTCVQPSHLHHQMLKGVRFKPEKERREEEDLKRESKEGEMKTKTKRLIMEKWKSMYLYIYIYPCTGMLCIKKEERGKVFGCHGGVHVKMMMMMTRPLPDEEHGAGEGVDVERLMLSRCRLQSLSCRRSALCLHQSCRRRSQR